MTAQISDTILIEGYKRLLYGEPLYSWLARRNNKALRFQRQSTACWRGYVAEWQVFNGRLFLKSIQGRHQDGSVIQIEDLFVHYSREYLDSVKAYAPSNAGPGQFAFWFSGCLECPVGKLQSYAHMGYMSVHEKMLVLHVHNGFVTGQHIITHDTGVEANQSNELDGCDDFR